MRNQDFRHSRHREFDADTYNPQPRAFGTRPRFSETRFESTSDPPVRAVVKWFNPEKGFGFVELSDGSGDGFLHGTVLAQNGISAVQPGDTLEVAVGPGHTGPHVTEVLSVDISTGTPTTPPRSSYRVPTSGVPSSDLAVEETGTVKWFNIEKGFGFIARDGGGRTYSSTSRPLNDPGSRPLTKESVSSWISSRGEKGSKRRGYAWSRLAHTH